MFKYDQDFIAEHMDAAMSFFGSLIWRFFLVKCPLLFLAFLGVVSLFPTVDNFLYFIMYIIDSIFGLIALSISLWLVRNKRYIDKKKGLVTYLDFRCSSSEGISDRSLIFKISLQLFWRTWVLSTGLYLIASILSSLLNLNLLEGSIALVIGLMGFMLGWMWFVLFNPRATTFIDFKSEAVEG